MKFHFQFFLFSFIFSSVFFLFDNVIVAQEKIRMKPQYQQMFQSVLAEVEGTSVTWEDIRNRQIQDTANTLYQAILSELPQYTLEKLSAIHQELDPSPQVIVTEEQIRAFYQTNRLQSRGTYEQLKTQMQTYLETQYRLEKIHSQFMMAIENGWVKIYLAPPSELLMEASANTAYIR